MYKDGIIYIKIKILPITIKGRLVLINFNILLLNNNNNNNKFNLLPVLVLLIGLRRLIPSIGKTLS